MEATERVFPAKEDMELSLWAVGASLPEIWGGPHFDETLVPRGLVRLVVALSSGTGPPARRPDAAAGADDGWMWTRRVVFFALCWLAGRRLGAPRCASSWGTSRG